MTRPSRPGSVIRTYHGGLVPSATRLPALAVASGILRDAGLDVEWRMCEEEAGQAGADPCAEPLGPNELDDPVSATSALAEQGRSGAARDLGD